MLLTIDVGNTQTVIGLFEEPLRPGSTGTGPSAGLLDHWRIATNANRTGDEYALVMQEFLAFHGLSFTDAMGGIEGIALCSVVPRVTAALRTMVQRYFEFLPLVLEPGVRTGMPILYDNPKEVGADRIADAVAAFDLFGGPAIVIDFGTATTIDAVSAKGEYLGGAIVPGIEVSLDALFERAAGLRRVELAEPRQVIGRSTAESIQSGALFGFAALVDGLCERMQDIVGTATVVATGGLAEVIAPHSKLIGHVEPWLTLHGLRCIHRRNRA
jgi:type III pantothenate kinase